MNVTLWKNIGVFRGVAMLLVVLNHAFLLVGFARNQLSTVWPYSTLERVLYILGMTVPFAAVAGFMIASGYFMARMSSSRETSRSAAKSLAGRYLSWTVAWVCLRLLLERSYTWDSVVHGLLQFWGPYPAYWFFPVMLLVLLLCPWLSALAQRKPLVLVAIIACIEVLRALIFYVAPTQLGVSLARLSGSYFLIGFLLAKHTEWVLRRLLPLRRWLGILTLMAFAVSVAETVHWWNEAGGLSPNVLSNDRLSVRIYAIIAVAWALVRPTQQHRWTNSMNDIGLKSLAFLLTFDFFQHAMLIMGWHLPSVLDGASADRPWVAQAWYIPIYFAAGTAGPLFSVYLVERFLGKARRRTLFG